LSFARIITVTVFTTASLSREYSAERKSNAVFFARSGNRDGNNYRFGYGFLSFVGKSAAFLSLVAIPGLVSGTFKKPSKTGEVLLFPPLELATF